MNGHAGSCRRFLVFDAEPGTEPRAVARLDLPNHLAIREFSGDGPHPLDSVEALIVSRAGPGAIAKMSARKVEVVATSERDPAAAVAKYLAGSLPVAADPGQPMHQTNRATEFLKAMANETRLQILCALCPGERCVSELERKLALSQSKVSQELGRLRRAGLVAGRHAGSCVYYRLTNRHVSAIIRAVFEAYCDQARNTD